MYRYSFSGMRALFLFSLSLSGIDKLTHNWYKLYLHVLHCPEQKQQQKKKAQKNPKQTKPQKYQKPNQNKQKRISSSGFLMQTETFSIFSATAKNFRFYPE